MVTDVLLRMLILLPNRLFLQYRLPLRMLPVTEFVMEPLQLLLLVEQVPLLINGTLPVGLVPLLIPRLFVLDHLQ